MCCSGLRALSLASICCIVSSSVFAQCSEDRRAQKVGNDSVQLRTYLCRTGQGPDDAQVKVEIDRLSDAAASIIVTRRASHMLTQVIGTPKLIDNSVSKTYSDLLREFGVTLGRGLSLETIRIRGAASGGTGSESQHTLDKTIKILGNSDFRSAPDYPAIEEIVALENRKIPPGLKYFYSVDCKDNETISGSDRLSTCKNYNPQQTTMLFWRSMKADDITNFSRRMTAYNRRYAPKDNAKHILIPRELRLASHLAGNTWPEDFMVVAGTPKGGGCVVGDFWYGLRVFMLDVAIIENVSTAQISVDNILGDRLLDTQLRVANSFAPRPKSGNPLGFVVGRLAPGEKVLVPLRIVLGADEETARQFRYRETASQIHKQVGARGYGGNVGGFGAPNFRNYVYGPEFSISGLLVNGTRVDLAGSSANYFEMTMSAEEGSCPYLLSRTKNGDWIDHGKILHTAAAKDREYSEIRSFRGFKRHFRLEEREPEIAFIDQVEIDATLNDGRTLTLTADNPKLASRDGDYLRLLWGDAIDINFTLPTDVQDKDVVESRLSVTGYYERYSNLMAKSGTNEPMTRPSGLASDPVMTIPTVSRR
jgi:hypothetical protein